MRKKLTINQVAKQIPKRYRFWVLLVVAAFGLGLGFFLQGKCISVADGDTITVLSENGEILKVRLYGIDAPELGQNYGENSASATQSLVLLKKVNLDIQDTDQYGRAVAIVSLEDGLILNEELVKTGQAFVYNEYCKHPRCIIWKAYEAKAKFERIGLWAADKPVAPWTWRKKHKG